MQDVVAALITYLKTDSDLTALVSDRVYGGKIPPDAIAAMPRKCVLIRAAGSLDGMRTHRSQRARVDVLSFGEDHYEAGRVDGVVAEALMSIARTVAADTLLHAAGWSAGARHLIDPDTHWDYVLRTSIVVAGETVVT